ncbi:glycoside hydrolase superfamily [Ganoderma leucocontextum]|nr:glycoside hydrolase superfamily [Ganoderma leucocontextum]
MPGFSNNLPFCAALCALLLVVAAQAAKFDMTQSSNLAIYWGQNDNQPDLMDVCQSDSSDTVILAFVSAYPTSTGSMTYNFGSDCGQDELDGCAKLGDAVKACQAAGKIVTVSIGGGDAFVVLSSDDEAKTFGEMIYDTFLGGKGQKRPFGDIVLDGVDLDIEGGQTTYFPSFVDRMWEYAKEQGDTRKYYLTGAPQCPFPDGYMSYVLNHVPFDAIYIQFYNNEPTCGLQVEEHGWDNFNFGTWDDWASNTSPNKHVKLYVGAPASQSAGNYYVEAGQMGTIIGATRQNYSSFGGVMLWDAGNARDNGNFDTQMKNFLMKSGGGAPPSSTESTFRTDVPASTSASSTLPATDTDEGRPTSSIGSNVTTDGGEITSRRRHKTSSGFETSRGSATATAGNTCRTPADSGKSEEDH